MVARQRLFVALTLAALLLILAPGFAQDATPTETPTATLTPTETPTETPSATSTETATTTLTETPTETISPTAGETAIATASITPSETPTLAFATLPAATETATATASATQPTFPPEPPLTLLFSDNFDTGALYLWTLGEGWALVPSEGGQALQATNSDAPVTFVHNNLSDIAVSARVQFDGGMARLSIRQSEVGAYTALLSADGQVALYRGGQVIGSAVVAANTPGVWRTLRLSAIDDLVRVAVDGVEVVTVQDANPLPQGTISFAGIGASALTVDDVEVLTASTTPEATPSFTPSATATAATQDMELLYSETFSGENSPFAYFMNGNLRFGPGIQTEALHIWPDSGKTQFAPHVPVNFIIEMQVLFTSGTTYINIRETEPLSYKISLNTDGTVTLYEGNNLVDTLSVLPNAAAQWRTLRVSWLDDVLRVAIDGTEIIAFADDTPLPFGGVSFGGDNLDSNGLLVDNLTVWSKTKTVPDQTKELLSSEGSTFGEIMAASAPGAYATYVPMFEGIIFTGQQTINTVEDTPILDTNVLFYPNPQPRPYIRARNADFFRSGNNLVQRRVFECTIYVNSQTTQYDLCVSNGNGSNFLNLTSTSSEHEFNPAFSPDGNWVAYTVVINGAREIWAVNVNTLTKLSVFVPNDAPALFDRPFISNLSSIEWTSTNNIYFHLQDQTQSGGYGFAGIFKVNFNMRHSVNQVRLGTHNWFDITDNEKIIYWQHSLVTGNLDYHRLWLVDPSVSTSPVLLQGGYDHISLPSWSPDSRRIAYLRSVGGASGSELWIIDNNPSNPNPRKVLNTNYISFYPFEWTNIVVPIYATATPDPTHISATQTAIALTREMTPEPPGGPCALPPSVSLALDFTLAGGLLTHEGVWPVGAGEPAHTISKHVGVDPTFLYFRLLLQPRVPASTSYWDVPWLPVYSL